MKNNESLYFDIWRKRNFKSLIEAYIETAANNETKKEMILAFGYALNKYVEGGAGAYKPNYKQWSTAYILGRELGVFYIENEAGGYNLSPLAQNVLLGKLTLEGYLLNYFLNFNQLIDGVVVHPLREVLLCLADNSGKITIEHIKSIEKFNLQNKTTRNQNQVANILLNRLLEAEILKKEQQYYSLSEYKFSTLFDEINLFEGSVSDFEKLSHKEFVELLSRNTNLISSKEIYGDGLFEYENKE